MYECVGGGRIQHDSANKKLFVYGYSMVRRWLCILLAVVQLEVAVYRSQFLAQASLLLHVSVRAGVREGRPQPHSGEAEGALQGLRQYYLQQ